MTDEPEIEIYRDPRDGDGGPRRGRPVAPRIIAITGAKGGVGKTIFATNVAIYLATIGRRVMLVDADPSGANAHALLDIDLPADSQATPAPFAPTVTPVAEDRAIVDTPIPGLRLYRPGLDSPLRGHRRRATRRGLYRALRERTDADYFVVDLGSGTARSLLDFWLDADLGVYLTVPEPTSIRNTYTFIRACFARHLRRRAPTAEVRARAVSWLRRMGNTPAPLDLARRLDAAGDDLSDRVRDAVDTLPLKVVLNQTRVRADLELGESMRSAVRRRFGLHLEYLGYIDYDDTVWSCVRMRRPLLVESPGTKASKSLEKITRRLLALESGKSPQLERAVPPESHHDLLEIDRGASEEDVRRAYKRVREIYASDALVCYGLFDSQSMETLRARLEEAYDVLLDPARRRPYELSVFPPDPEPALLPLEEEHAEPAPAAPIITPDTEFSGALLRAVRESQSVDLHDVCHRTKISVNFVRAIEEDDFAKLPAPVYVRGFVAEIAKFLRLDTAHASRTYLRRYRRFLEERERGAS